MNLRPIILLLSIGIIACSHVQRPYYDRSSGSYKTPEGISAIPKSTLTTKSSVDVQIQPTHLTEICDSWLGTPYLYGGSDKNGVDCSGLTSQILYEYAALKLPRTSREMYTGGQEISQADFKPGDLVFFGTETDIHHVGVLISKDVFFHASSSKGAEYRSLNDPYWAARFKGIRRYIP